jgi:hypothetical protein
MFQRQFNQKRKSFEAEQERFPSALQMALGRDALINSAPTSGFASAASTRRNSIEQGMDVKSPTALTAPPSINTRGGNNLQSLATNSNTTFTIPSMTQPTYVKPGSDTIPIESGVGALATLSPKSMTKHK